MILFPKNTKGRGEHINISKGQRGAPKGQRGAAPLYFRLAGTLLSHPSCALKNCYRFEKNALTVLKGYNSFFEKKTVAVEEYYGDFF